jgi:DoxX-like family
MGVAQKMTFLPRFLRYLLAVIWFGSGFFAKILNLVPRHTQIVGRLLDAEYARGLTMTIGCLEILMAVWILSRIWPRFCAATQVALVVTMTLLEVIYTPDLLLFGRFNLLPGFLFCCLVLLYLYTLTSSQKKASSSEQAQ